MNTFANYQNKVLEEWNTYGMHKIYDINNINNINNTNQSNYKEYKFIDGPPFCSGNLHIAHCAIGTIKSTILNYKAMMGFHCHNKLGYDCHGLPIESVANKALEISTLEDLDKIGIVKFNEFCKNTIKQCERDWEPIYNRIGRWADFDNVYKTMDTPFMESVWWGFSELYRKGLIYRGYKITPYSYALQSPISNFEASQNYKEVDCKSIYVRFELLPEHQFQNKPTYIVAWTTTPWTLPANIALCVNATLEYEYIEDDQCNVYILGKDTYKNTGIKFKQLIKTVKGVELINIRYKPIYNTYTNITIQQTIINHPSTNLNKVVADDYVKESGNTGTNIVHLAPVFGEDDYRVCMEKGLITNAIVKSMNPIDSNCKYLPMVEKYSGMLVFDAEALIIKELKESKVLLKIQQIRHEYPYCYRTDTPLVYRACDAFYVDIQKIKERMIELNTQINWYPENIGTQRFHKWLEGARDWCISRSRYFGTPIPVWMSEDSEDDSEDDILVIKSIRELENYSGLMLNDIHPEYVNDIIIIHPTNGKKYKRVPDIFDCWFESGSVPFAQYHYPFENKDAFEEKLSTLDSLSDFIVEGLDQTRGWFYTLLVLSTALFDKKPAHNIMVVGTILDEHRKKISKKTKNYVDPLILIDNYGADAIRLYLLQSQITNAEPLAFKEDDIKIINKDLFQFNNSVAFLVEHITNQKHHNVNFNILAYQQTTNPMDKWILLNINNIQSQVITLMDNYQIAKAARMIIELIEDITNWYLKFNRDRLKGKAGNEEWIISTSVLFQVIKQYIILLAPFAPFLSQSIYKELSTIYSSGVQFVHMEDYNKFIENETIDGNGNNYLETFELLKRVSKLVRSARMNTKTHTSSKTPIKACEICMDSPKMLEQIASCIDLIQSELNVIDIKYSMLSGNLKYKVVPNKPVLGKKYKKLANEIYKVMETLTYNDETITTITKLKQLDISLPNTNNENYIILEEEFAFEPIFNDGDIFDSNAQNNILIKIDFTYDAQIEKLAHLKRFIADVQQTRKHMGLKPWNKITIHIYEDDFDIISDNINLEYIMKRLECEVIPNSQKHVNKSDIKYYIADINDDDADKDKDNENDKIQKQIYYEVELLAK